jgi:IS1 family transposase
MDSSWGNKKWEEILLLLSPKDSEALFWFNLELPKVEKYYTDGHFGYENVYGKKASRKKSRFTNIVENLNSQVRDKISYLVRRSKAPARSFEWLDNRLAMFFVELNLKYNNH